MATTTTAVATELMVQHQSSTNCSEKFLTVDLVALHPTLLEISYSTKSKRVELNLVYQEGALDELIKRLKPLDVQRLLMFNMALTTALLGEDYESFHHEELHWG